MLRTIEIYGSIQGESTWAGLPCTFIRLAGCNLRCTWCDSTYTFKGGEPKTIGQILEAVKQIGISLIEVTGGEPLVHKETFSLLRQLVEQKYTVLLETSGSRDISQVPPEVHTILDLKPPDSGEERANLWSNLDHLKPTDEIKFVIASRRDYEWSRDKVTQLQLNQKCTTLFSCVWNQVKPDQLVSWILEDRLNVRFQLQMHKVIWEPTLRGV